MIVWDVVARGSTADDLMSFVAALRRSGQCADPWPAFVEVEGTVRFRLSTPADNSLDPRYDSAEVKECRAKAGTLEVVRLGREEESADACACAERPFLVLFTTFICRSTPLRCGGCWNLVPLYELPSDSERLLGWASTYRALDTLYMNSGVGEAFSYAQLSRHDSVFGTETLVLCGEVEKRSGLPVYAYLNRVTGLVPAVCPACGAAWSPDPGPGPWKFRCEPCRILQPEPCDLREP